MPASYVLPQAKQTDGTAYLKGTLAPRALFPRLPVSVAVSVKWGTVSGTRAFIGLSHAASFGAIVLGWNNFWSTSVVYCKPSSGYELVYLREDRGVPISSTGSLTRGAITAEPSYTVLFGQRNTVSRGFQGCFRPCDAGSTSGRCRWRASSSRTAGGSSRLGRLSLCCRKVLNRSTGG